MFDDIVAFVARADLLVALRDELGGVQGKEAQEGAILSAAALVAALADWATEPEGQTWLRTELPSLDSSLEHVSDLSASDEYFRFGEELVARLFGWRADRLTAQVAATSGLRHDDAAVVLATTAWITAGHLARQHDDSGGIEGLAEMLGSEEQGLRAVGWGPWLDEALAVARREEPSHRRAAPPAGPVGRPRALAREPSPAAGGGRHGPSTRRRWALALLVLVLLGVGLVAYLLRASGNGEGVATPDPATAATIGGAADGGDDDQSSSSATSTTTSSNAVTTAATATIETTTADDAEVPEIVEYSLDLVDTRAIGDAGGTVDLILNTATGEVCYSFDVDGLATPYPAHLHVGPSGGAGGITVDFGLLERIDSGCVQGHPADLVAAVNRPGARYVEAHDPSGALTVRSQLVQPEPDEQRPEAVDEIGDRAHAVVVDGTIVLRGQVPDLESWNALVDSYRDLDGSSIQVVNELSLAPDADPPSDQVIIEDSVLFDFDSSELTPEAISTLAGLAEVLAARSTWSVIAVGHTDSSGPVFHNFTLSLRRARAVQAALIELGVPQLMVTVEGFGPLIPVADNASSAGRSVNRRIDFVMDAGG